jgi:hypothetical protein
MDQPTNPYQAPRTPSEPDRTPHQAGTSRLKTELALVVLLIFCLVVALGLAAYYFSVH